MDVDQPLSQGLFSPPCGGRTGRDWCVCLIHVSCFYAKTGPDFRQIAGLMFFGPRGYHFADFSRADWLLIVVLAMVALLVIPFLADLSIINFCSKIW